IRLPWAPPDDREDVPIAAFAHNCPVPDYGLDALTLRKAIQAYYATVAFLDAQVGRLLDALDAEGIRDNTIVVFWSDHGYHLGEHDGVWQKRTLFEQGARAPLIIRAPLQMGSGTPCPRVVEFVDIYPTLVELAGLPMPDHPLAGRSLVPLLTNPLAEWNGEAITQILRPDDDRLDSQVMGCSIRTNRWRYTEWADGEAGVELYDHFSDPGEFHNLAAAPDAEALAVIDRLRPRLRAKSSGSIPAVPVNPARL
ncbi:MAG: sulfatase-like hydrolase/transferase, partial [Verrucomicrobiota bacterium]